MVFVDVKGRPRYMLVRHYVTVKFAKQSAERRVSPRFGPERPITDEAVPKIGEAFIRATTASL